MSFKVLCKFKDLEIYNKCIKFISGWVWGVFNCILWFFVINIIFCVIKIRKLSYFKRIKIEY